jgi:hypothetical protein
MTFFKWVPPDLSELHAELILKVKDELKQVEDFKATSTPQSGKLTDFDRADFRVGFYWLGAAEQLKILEKLISNPAMQDVWEKLERRANSFKPLMSLHGGKTCGRNLFGACVEAESDWGSTPKMTRTQSRKFYDNIASLSLQLAELLVDESSPDLVEVRRFINKESRTHFVKELEQDGHELWYGFDGYLDYLLSELLGTVPGILLQLHKRALEQAKTPVAISQPNSPSAKVNFFIRWLSNYFTKSYGQPLHSHVASVTNVLLGSDVDEDRVRALIRSRKVAVQRRTRQKLIRLREEKDG